MALRRTARRRARQRARRSHPDRHRLPDRGSGLVRRYSGGGLLGNPIPLEPSARCARARTGKSAPDTPALGRCGPAFRGRARIHFRALRCGDSCSADPLCVVLLRCSSRRHLCRVDRCWLRNCLPEWGLGPRLHTSYLQPARLLSASGLECGWQAPATCCITLCWVSARVSSATR